VRALVIVLLLTTTVRADAPGEAAIQAGTELAKQSRFNEAIAQFKAAHIAAPGRPEPDCLIALAYRYLERWGQARLFLGRCTLLASHTAWIEQLVADVDSGIAHGGLTQVTFGVTPAAAQIELASFPHDETFAPQPIFLEPGKQLATVSAPGFATQQLAIDVPATGPYEVKVDLRPITGPSQPQAAPSSPPQPGEPRPARKTGKYVVVASAGIVAVGVAVHIVAAVQRSDLTANAMAYYNGIDTFHTERDVAIGAYALGAIGLAVGAWLWHREVAPVVESHAVGVAWSGSW
jgi:hypothetical protein